MHKKKIIYIDEDARYGGPQHRMILVANELKDKFDFLFLISKNDNTLFKRKLNKTSLKYKEISITRLSKHTKTLIKYLIFFFPELLCLIIHLKKLNADLVQVNSTPHFKALIASSILRIPTLWVLEDCNLPKSIKIAFKILYFFFKPKIIVTSEVVKNYYLKNYKLNKNLRKIYAPVSTKEFNLNKYKKKIFNKKKVNILMIANLTKVKGIEILLKLIKISPKNYSFTLCGGYNFTHKKYANDLIKQFKKFSKNKLNYIGHQEDIPKIISKCDFMICTSLSEAGPMTSIEAMCMKKPLISSKVGIISELFKNNIDLLIVKKNYPKNFLKSIKYLVSKQDLQKKIIKNAYNIVINKLTVNQISKKYDSFYKYTIIN